MTTFRFFAVAALAAATLSVQADEADSSQYSIRFNAARSAADVRTEAMNPVRISNGGTGFIGITNSGISRQAVKAEAAQSARAGQTSRGEIGTM